IDAQWERQRLESLPELLSQVRGALAMIPLPRAASLMRGCTDYVDEQLMINDAVPSAEQLEHFADVISGLEYYLERMLQDPDAAGERVLELATRGLAALGYLPAEKPWRQAL
ncbi:hypothetical protein HX835_30310, partial [Pseudomonas veronii]|nr:hypothetical protein [Pseudomonas veronii]